MSVFVAESIGTFLLILLGNGVVANVVLKGTKFGGNDAWIVITTAWAFAVYVGVVVAGSSSGAHLNPAVTISFAILEKISWAVVPTYIGAQLLGAFLGALTVYLFYIQHYRITESHDDKLVTFSTIPAIRHNLHNFISECIGTFVLIFVILYITGASFEFNNTEIPIGLGSIGALPVAILVWGIGLSLGGTTGYAINPARDLGPRLAHTIIYKGKSNWNYAWIPVLGPITGSVLAAFLYLLIF
ncbi:glycerol uptake facilitator protein [Tenacibaculum sp. MAR_2009_124]|uniref:MIP/aquaporin family protein n=1 Tax=Tenacibaculum sp. MAR_2009_124 TaxID=1250059 RepID=UPI00089753D3|nr:MIP/aquaporin family protein [Tenacibaculum sp. MAR_2009_124]SEC19429.1 glycerol uptake facilitator protein [Tenacibaculum sp. MAR_2009_124]